MKLSPLRISLVIIAVILLLIIFKTIHYLTSQDYIVECFTNNIIDEKYDSSTSHTVDLPLTTTYSCKNFCSPTSRCAITGQQCFTDIDCPGCQPYVPPLKKTKDCIPGDNDAGKLTTGVTPQYSNLTSGYGTQKRVITNNMYGKPAQPNFGVNTWMSSFNAGEKLFNKRYKPNQLEYMPKYPPMYSITGEFIGDGPLPSNF
jgi:hypothetical protein